MGHFLFFLFSFVVLIYFECMKRLLQLRVRTAIFTVMSPRFDVGQRDLEFSVIIPNRIRSHSHRNTHTKYRTMQTQRLRKMLFLKGRESCP